MLPYDPSTHVPLLIRGPGHPARPHDEGRRRRRRPGSDHPRRDPGAGSRALDGRSILPFARNVRRRRLRPLLHTTAGQGARADEHPRGRRARHAATRAGLERHPNDALALRRVQGRPARALRPSARPMADQLGRGDPTLRVRTRTLRRILGDLRRCRGSSTPATRSRPSRSFSSSPWSECFNRGTCRGEVVPRRGPGMKLTDSSPRVQNKRRRFFG